MKRNHYNEILKSEAVKLALSGELSYLEIAKDLEGKPQNPMSLDTSDNEQS